MSKKMNYVAIIPFVGSLVLLFWLFIKTAKAEVNIKQVYVYFFISAGIGSLLFCVPLLLLFLINIAVSAINLLNIYGILVSLIIGGYLMNLFVFIFINKKWSKLERKD